LKIYAIISYPFLPATTGGEISTQNILEYMARVNEVKVFTVDPYQPINPKDYSFELDFGMRFKASRYLNPFLFFTILKGIKAFKADAIFFDQPWMGWMIPFLRLLTRKPVFLRSNNIEYLRFKSMGKSWWSLLYMYEKLVYKMCNLVIFVSDIDQAKAIYEFDLKSENTLLTPYGIPQSSLPEPIPNAKKIIQERHAIPSHHPIFLFFATLSYQPNYDAVAFIANEIEPRLNQALPNGFTILICGKNLPAHLIALVQTKTTMQYLGFVADIETYIDGANLMLNPIMSGGGVKTKAIDTLGRGKTVISTAIGAEGIDPKVCSDYLKIAAGENPWDDFVKLIIQQLSAEPSSFPNAFFETYSWSGIIEKLMGKLRSTQTTNT
jgi:hypothetical protein